MSHPTRAPTRKGARGRKPQKVQSLCFNTITSYTQFRDWTQALRSESAGALALEALQVATRVLATIRVLRQAKGTRARSVGAFDRVQSLQETRLNHSQNSTEFKITETDAGGDGGRRGLRHPARPRSDSRKLSEGDKIKTASTTRRATSVENSLAF